MGEVTGWNRPGRNKASAAKAKSSSHGVVLWVGIGVTAVLAFFVVWHWLPKDETATPAPVKATKPKPISAAKPAPAPVVVETESKPKGDPRKAALREELKKLSPEERRDYAFKMMQKREIDLTPTTNRPFRTGIELSMARIFMTRVGDPPPPLHTTFLPIQDEAHLAEILVANNPVIDGDSDEVKEAKATVEMVKKEMASYIKAGGNPEDFMSYYHDKLRVAFEERRESIKEVARIALQEPEIAQSFYESVNKRLKDKGIRPLEFTDRQKEKLGLE